MATPSPTGMYRPRRPERTVLYRVLSQHFERYLVLHDERFGRTHGPLRPGTREAVYQVRNRSGQDPLDFPIKVNNRLANLLSMVERGDGAPNWGMREIFDIMVEELDGYTTRLQEIWETDLAAVNAELERLGVDRVDPMDESVELTAPQGDVP